MGGRAADASTANRIGGNVTTMITTIIIISIIIMIKITTVSVWVRIRVGGGR